MTQPALVPDHEVGDTVRVSVVVKDQRGFTHYYEDVVTTPDAVRDAFDLMARRAPATGHASSRP